MKKLTRNKSAVKNCNKRVKSMTVYFVSRHSKGWISKMQIAIIMGDLSGIAALYWALSVYLVSRHSKGWSSKTANSQI